MNWLSKISQQNDQPEQNQPQNIELNMISMSSLKDTEYANIAASILRTFSKLFRQIPLTLSLEKISIEFNPQNAEVEIVEAVANDDSIQFDSWEETFDFMDSQKISMKYFDMLHNVEKSLEFDGLSLTEENFENPQKLKRFISLAPKISETIKRLNQEIKELSNIMVRSYTWDRSEVRLFYFDSLEALKQLESIRSEPSTTGLGIVSDHRISVLISLIAKITKQYLTFMSVDESGLVLPEIPELINEKKFIQNIKKTYSNKATAYFLSSDSQKAKVIREKAKELHEKKQDDLYNSQKTEFDHAIGYVDGKSWLEILKTPFEFSNSDPRVELEATTLNSIADSMKKMSMVSGTKETSMLIKAHILAIQMAAFKNENLVKELESSIYYSIGKDKTPEQLIEFLNSNSIAVPENLNSRDASSHIYEVEEFLKNVKRSIKQRLYQYTPEDEEKMKELGIAKKVPEIAYSVTESEGYPGQGVINNRSYFKDLPKFIITFAPTADLLNKKEIPKKLVEEFHQSHLHGSYPRVNDMPSMGWVGGTIDVKQRSMYVFELQSDLMQNTNQMRDPRKIEEERRLRREQAQKEIESLRSEIATIKEQGEVKKKDPRAGLRAKLKGIQEDIAKVQEQILELSNANTQMEASPEFTPDFGPYKHNLGLIVTRKKQLEQLQTQETRMSENIARITDQNKAKKEQNEIPDESQQTSEEKPLNQNEQRIKNIEDKISNLEQEIDNSRKPIPSYEKPHWHDYRNVVENTFSDWIKIFWNTVMREAYRNNIKHLYIVTANSLSNELWRSYGRDSKKELFERVYDSYAQIYNGTLTTKEGIEFWHIDLKDKAVKFASSHSWLNKISYVHSFMTVK